MSSDNALSSNAEDDVQAETVTDEDPRNKRFLFNLRGGAGGGSGNFLFDLIRVSVINIYTWFLFYTTCTLPTFLSFSILSRNRKNTTNCYIIHLLYYNTASCYTTRNEKIFTTHIYVKYNTVYSYLLFASRIDKSW